LLGWLDVLLPTWLPYAYLAALIAVSMASGARAVVGWTDRALALGVFALTAVVAMVLMYLIYSSVGMTVVAGFQGRYLLPVSPVLFLVFHAHWARSRITTVAAVAAVALVVTAAAVAGVRLVERFYVAELPSHAIETAAIPPGRDVVIIRGWAVDRAAGTVAKGVEVELDGRPYRARYGLERNDVALRLGQASYRFSGFEAQIPVAEVSRGLHTIALRIVASEERSYVIPESRGTLTFK
jgi:Predicted membrane protein (DUF2142)